MTLILTAITPEHIVQVSDMKLTLPTGEVADDHAAKMVLWCGRTLVAYTGLACIHATRTDVWLAEVLAQAVSFENGVRRIRQRLTATLAGDRHLEVMLAGWVKTEPDGDCKPVVAEVSNVRDWDWSHPPRRYFESTTRLVPSHAVGHLGQPLLAEVECVLADRLAASGDHPAVMANAMVEAVRSLARTSSADRG